MKECMWFYMCVDALSGLLLYKRESNLVYSSRERYTIKEFKGKLNKSNKKMGWYENSLFPEI